MLSCGIPRNIPLVFSDCRVQNNTQQVASPDDQPNIFQPGQTPILAGQIMNTIIYIFCLFHYAGNRSLQCIDVQVFVAKLVKNSFTQSFLSSFLQFLLVFMSFIPSLVPSRPISDVTSPVKLVEKIPPGLLVLSHLVPSLLW